MRVKVEKKYCPLILPRGVLEVETVHLFVLRSMDNLRLSTGMWLHCEYHSHPIQHPTLPKCRHGDQDPFADSGTVNYFFSVKLYHGSTRSNVDSYETITSLMPIKFWETYVTSLTLHSTACLCHGTFARFKGRVWFSFLEIKLVMSAEEMFIKWGVQVIFITEQFLIYVCHNNHWHQNLRLRAGKLLLNMSFAGVSLD